MKINLKELCDTSSIYSTSYNTWYQGRIEYTGVNENVLALRLNNEQVLIIYKDGDMEVLTVSSIASGNVNLFKVDVEINVL